MSLAWKEDRRPQRFGWAPGSYLNHCHGAGCKDLEDKTFIGDKRAVICADCAYALPDPTPEKPPEQLTKEILLKRIEDMWRQIHALDKELERKCASLT
jgi:hypothetical protein